MDELVSVIIPTYNRADLLQKALKSVIDQTYQNLEIIIIDDGSTDHTFFVVKSFDDSRILYVYQKNRGSPAISRNVGLKQFNGEFVAFLDDDDMWVPDRIERQLALFSTHPEYGMVYSNAYSIDLSDNVTGLLRDPSIFRDGDIFESLIDWDYIPFLTILVRREVINQYGYFNEDPILKFVEDYEFIFRLSKKIKIGFIFKPLAYYRISHENNSTRHDPIPGLLTIYLSLYTAQIQSFKSKIRKKILSLLLSLLKRNAKQGLNFSTIYWIILVFSFISNDFIKKIKIWSFRKKR